MDTRRIGISPFISGDRRNVTIGSLPFSLLDSDSIPYRILMLSHVTDEHNMIFRFSDFRRDTRIGSDVRMSSDAISSCAINCRLVSHLPVENKEGMS